MAARDKQTTLLRVAAVCAALTVLAMPASYALGLAQIGHEVLSDTYYLAMNTDRIGMVATLGVAHQVGAILCLSLAHARPGAVLAGWTLTVSASLLVVAEFSAVAIFTLAARPQRYVDFFSQEVSERGYIDLARVYDVVLWVDLAAFVGMAVGWLILAFSRATDSRSGTPA